MADIAATVMNATQSLSLPEFYSTVGPLIYYIIALAIYALFIFKFYRFVACRDVFRLDLAGRREGRHAKIALYILEYLILFPVLIFVWFGVFSAFLVLLTRAKPLAEILLMSMALVATIRITSYHNEDLSRDLAKLLPLVLLAIFIIERPYISITESMSVLYQMPAMWKAMVYYMAFVICLEFVLRILYSAWHHSRKRIRGEGVLEMPEPRQA